MTFAYIIISLLLILCHFEKLYNRKQHISQLIQVAKFLKNTQNFPNVPLLWLNDNDIIYDAGLGCENESIDQGRSYYNKNINISNCFFSRYFLFSESGGVIYVRGGSYSMNINYSMFYNCVCSNQGGAIYFYSDNSRLRMICANSCSCGASSDYQYALLQTSQGNQVEYLSVSNCSHITSGYCSIRLNSGIQIVDKSNSSMNNAKEGSGIDINSPSSFTSSYCTFSNNKVSRESCIYFYSTSGTITMSYANIVQNNSPIFNGVVTVNGAGSRKMIYCIFHNNQNYLFCVEEGSLEVSHSYISLAGALSTSSEVSFANNNSFSNIQTYQLQFYNSLHCNTDIPLEQRSFEQTIRRTYEETLRMTYEILFDQTIRETLKETIHRSYAECIFTHQMANWREISVIFSFSFLYPVTILMIS